MESVQIGSAILGCGQKVEYRPIMPNVIDAELLDLGNVGLNPSNEMSLFLQPDLSQFQRGR